MEKGVEVVGWEVSLEILGLGVLGARECGGVGMWV